MSNPPRTDTKILADAMDILARDIQSPDGVANAAIAEAAGRLREMTARTTELYKALETLLDHVKHADPDQMHYAIKYAESALHAGDTSVYVKTQGGGVRRADPELVKAIMSAPDVDIIKKWARDSPPCDDFWTDDGDNTKEQDDE